MHEIDNSNAIYHSNNRKNILTKGKRRGYYKFNKYEDYS